MLSKTMEPAIGLNQALKYVMASMPGLPAIELPLAKARGYVLYQDVVSSLDLPPFAVSTIDGYALCADDVGTRLSSNHKTLVCTETITAGSVHSARLSAGTTVKVYTGGRLPGDTAAVVAEENVKRTGNAVLIEAHVLPGTNILCQGNDLAKQETVAKSGDLLNPGLAGLLAATGTNRVKVYRKPRVLVIATGDELVLPGDMPKPGKIFASNPAMIIAWLDRLKMSATVKPAPDDSKTIKTILESAVRNQDAVITTGGSWKSSRDMVLQSLKDLNWQPVFEHIRLVPGKSSSMGLLKSVPVFVLPGPPPACMAAFITLVVPALKLMAGYKTPLALTVKAKLTKAVLGRKHWSRVIFGRYQTEGPDNCFTPLKGKSRLKDLAFANACITIAENITELIPGALVSASLF